jgi:hypothetical protein
MALKNIILIAAFTILFIETGMAANSAHETSSFHSTTCRSDFGSYPVSDGSNAEVISNFIRKQIINLQKNQTALQLTFSNNSPGGYHYTFCQTYAGVPVFASEIVVNVSRKNMIYSIFDDSYDLSDWHVDMTNFEYQNVAAYQAYLKRYFTADITEASKQVVAFDEKTSTPALCYLVKVKGKNGSQRNVLIAKDRIIYEHDDCMYRAAPAAPDSLVSGMVFRPDPLTTAHVIYYAPYAGHDSAYQNYNDSDTYQLNIQREQKSFYANYNGGTFSLSNPYIRLTQLGADPTPPVTSPAPSFNFTRSQSGFLDVMVFYHLNVIRNYVHGLGFNAADTLIMPDPHAFGQDNDFFAEPNNIFYGTGGVPDCQDVDVIIHEYTHFLSWNSNHSNGAGASTQRNGIDEGSADYDATSYSASIDTFKWNWVFNWDGHNGYWDGRIVDDRTVYPATPTVPPGMGIIYKYGEIWSSALMQIWWDIGKGPADSLFFQTLYGLGSNITLPDAAQQYIKADSLLFNGKYHCTIVSDFNQHGLASDSICAVFPAGITAIPDHSDPVRFTAYPDGFRAVATPSDMPVHIDIYDITGQRLISYTSAGGEVKPSLPNGMYIVDVSSGGGHQAFKWMLAR